MSFRPYPRVRNIRGNLSFSSALQTAVSHSLHFALVHSSAHVEYAREQESERASETRIADVGNFKINYKRVTNFDTGPRQREFSLSLSVCLSHSLSGTGRFLRRRNQVAVNFEPCVELTCCTFLIARTDIISAIWVAAAAEQRYTGGTFINRPRLRYRGNTLASWTQVSQTIYSYFELIFPHTQTHSQLRGVKPRYFNAQEIIKLSIRRYCSFTKQLLQATVIQSSHITQIYNRQSCVHSLIRVTQIAV